MCGSKLDRETGTVTITTPSLTCPVGTRFAVRGSASDFMVEPADWVARLLFPPQPVSPDSTAAERALEERLGLGARA